LQDFQRVLKSKPIMTANVNKIPAGITTGTEAFYIDGVKWLIHNGESKPFDQFPSKIQNAIVEVFKNDLESRSMLFKMGFKGFSEQFENWYKCVVGGLDSIPDFSNWEQLSADVFANTCPEKDCPMRGKLCGRKVGLNYSEVARIRSFAEGHTIIEVAHEHFITEAAVKSSIERIHMKMNTRNMAQTIAVCGQMGII